MLKRMVVDCNVMLYFTYKSEEKQTKTGYK